MTSAPFFICRRPLDPDRRPAMALLASALLHALMLSSISEKPEVVAMRVSPYPRSAREQKVSGEVIVLLFADEEGKVVDTAAVEIKEQH